ncbi:hypothetical protein BKA70DRAFT_1531675 [Coprinopsis sp. MPI-PUGE-AT-0042]|nr:hypothetical protein BKA70DRAFT_1531675 [Coprinopsis sp. MPI-PUGE-AT-0042]
MSAQHGGSLSAHSTLGSVFVGFSVACTVFGIVLTQIFFYFRNYPGDRPIFKITVFLILLLEATDQGLIGHFLYHYSISSFGRPDVLIQAKMTWSLILQLTLGAVVGAIVKSYFAFRVWRFSNRNYFITGLVFLLTYGQLGLAIAFTVECFKLPNIYAVHRLQLLGSVSLGVGVLTDIVTAISLCFYLSKLRTGLQSSDSLVDNLCSYAINTGVLTSTVSVATLVLYNVLPTSNLYFVSLYFVLSKLYAISFMATLNTRRIVKGSRKGTDDQGATTNNTNLFHLGTARLPSMALPGDFGQWDPVFPRSLYNSKDGLRDDYHSDVKAYNGGAYAV